MPIIHLETKIYAPQTLVFDLARSIDLHLVSTDQTQETAIGGVTSGLIGLNETVTWRAKHFGIFQELTSKITVYNRPHTFSDEMVKGAFKRMKHDHYFKTIENYTLLSDTFDFNAPLGFLGTIAETLVLKNYMREFLVKRNATIKDYAESDKWQLIPFVGRS